ncbi:MAG: hypothetical protein M5R36_08190 [Deltaproteobacteria bacterium]|nr:hypothetical protein [Deltaproteobacteria bacterium]
MDFRKLITVLGLALVLLAAPAYAGVSITPSDTGSGDFSIRQIGHTRMVLRMARAYMMSYSIEEFPEALAPEDMLEYDETLDTAENWYDTAVSYYQLGWQMILIQEYEQAFVLGDESEAIFNFLEATAAAAQ